MVQCQLQATYGVCGDLRASGAVNSRSRLKRANTQGIGLCCCPGPRKLHLKKRTTLAIYICFLWDSSDPSKDFAERFQSGLPGIASTASCVSSKHDSKKYRQHKMDTTTCGFLPWNDSDAKGLALTRVCIVETNSEACSWSTAKRTSCRIWWFPTSQPFKRSKLTDANKRIVPRLCAKIHKVCAKLIKICNK